MDLSSEISVPQIASDMKKMPSDEMATAMDVYKSDKDSDSRDRSRGIRNVLSFCGLDYDQWDENEATDLILEGRTPKTYNLAQYYANGVAGNLVMNWIDPKFVDREDDSEEQLNRIQKLQQIYYADKEFGDYKNSAIKAIHNGCIYRGVEELIIDRTKDPLGRIRFVSKKPDSIILDPSNLTDDISRNAKRAHEEIYLNAEEMILYFPDAEKEVLNKIKTLKETDDRIGDRSEPSSAAGPAEPKNSIGNKQLCVVTHSIKMEKKRVVMDVLSGTILPETPFEEGTEEDFMAKKLWSQQKGIEVKAENLWITDKISPVNYLQTFCPSLGIVLENKKDERQLDGHIPFYCWALIMKGGKTLGVVDLILEAQRSINRREMAKDKTTSQTPWLGKPWYHAGMFEDSNNSSDESNFVRDFNDGSKPAKIPSSVPPGINMFGIMQGSQMPNGIFQDESWKIQLLNLISYLPPVLQGASGGANESGVLFGRKVIEANITQQIPAKNLEQHENYKAEDWVKMAIKLYGGRTQAEKIANLNRQFINQDNQAFTVNTLAGVDSDGNIVVDDDISKLNRVDVIISQSKENDYLKQANREVTIAALGAIPPSPTNDMIRATFEVSLAKNMDAANDDEKKAIEDACKMRMDIAFMQGQLMLSQLQSQLNPQPQMAAMPQQQPLPPDNNKLQERPQNASQINPFTVQGQPAVSSAERPV